MLFWYKVIPHIHAEVLQQAILMCSSPMVVKLPNAPIPNIAPQSLARDLEKKLSVDHIFRGCLSREPRRQASVTKTFVRSGTLVPLICGCDFRIYKRSAVPLRWELYWLKLILTH